MSPLTFLLPSLPLTVIGNGADKELLQGGLAVLRHDNSDGPGLFCPATGERDRQGQGRGA